MLIVLALGEKFNKKFDKKIERFETIGRITYDYRMRVVLIAIAIMAQCTYLYFKSKFIKDDPVKVNDGPDDQSVAKKMPVWWNRWY